MSKTMNELVTKHTKIVPGRIKYNSPISYTIEERGTGEPLQHIFIQKGPVQETNLNGIFIEDLLLIIKDQLEHFQASNFACQENEDTLFHVRQALNSTRARQYERLLRGVQGRNEE